MMDILVNANYSGYARGMLGNMALGRKPERSMYMYDQMIKSTCHANGDAKRVFIAGEPRGKWKWLMMLFTGNKKVNDWQKIGIHDMSKRSEAERIMRLANYTNEERERIPYRNGNLSLFGELGK